MSRINIRFKGPMDRKWIKEFEEAIKGVAERMGFEKVWGYVTVYDMSHVTSYYPRKRIYVYPHLELTLYFCSDDCDAYEKVEAFKRWGYKEFLDVFVEGSRELGEEIRRIMESLPAPWEPYEY